MDGRGHGLDGLKDGRGQKLDLSHFSLLSAIQIWFLLVWNLTQDFKTGPSQTSGWCQLLYNGGLGLGPGHPHDTIGYKVTKIRDGWRWQTSHRWKINVKPRNMTQSMQWSNEVLLFWQIPQFSVWFSFYISFDCFNIFTRWNTSLQVQNNPCGRACLICCPPTVQKTCMFG